MTNKPFSFFGIKKIFGRLVCFVSFSPFIRWMLDKAQYGIYLVKVMQHNRNYVVRKVLQGGKHMFDVLVSIVLIGVLAISISQWKENKRKQEVRRKMEGSQRTKGNGYYGSPALSYRRYELRL